MKHDKVLVEDFYNMGFYPNFITSFYWVVLGAASFVAIAGFIDFVIERL